MSYRLEIKSHGTVPEFGFWGPDTTKVMLGELQGIYSGQFCYYATETILNAVNDRKNRYLKQTKIRLNEGITSAENRNQHLPVRPTTNLRTLPQHRVLSERAMHKGPDITSHTISTSDDFWHQLYQSADTHDKNRYHSLIEEFFIAVNRSDESVTFYQTNPFVYHDSHIVIANTYTVTPPNFVIFALEYMGGGWFGWDTRGIPDFAFTNLQKLKQATQPPHAR